MSHDHSSAHQHSAGHEHGPAHQHSHHHGFCGGLDHHRGDYTPQQRADLDVVLAFNRRLSEAINAGLDTSATEAFLDPDPLRYMWVDEGQGRIPGIIAEADDLLAAAPRLEGFDRQGVRWVEGAVQASRPSLAVAPDGRRLLCWTEWLPDGGELVRTSLTGHGTDEEVVATVATVAEQPADVFRPTCAFTSTGEPWVFYGQRSDDAQVQVWGARLGESGWGEPELVTTTDHPSFNQEVVAHADGSLEVVWQGRRDDRFGIFSRRRDESGWREAELVSAGVEANVWDPATTALPDGATAYAWCEYVDGSYRIVVRRKEIGGALTEPQVITSGLDYALHPSLAATADGRLWCAFDVIQVTGHGGSGPTRLRPAELVGRTTGFESGMREPGDSVPPELLPEVSARIAVVEVRDGQVHEAPGCLAPSLDVVPSGLPKLVATADGGLTVVYRVHRRLPLMTYYWEVAAQSLGSDGWSAPTTFSGSDGTLEEVAVAPDGDTVLVAATMDHRLERALSWTEGFGGRECPYLLEHHGSIIWHGVHGIGSVVVGSVPSRGPAHRAPAAATGTATVHADERLEARRWATADGTDPRAQRRTIESAGQRYTLYWGDLHRHSLISRCTSGDEPSLEDFYRYAWDVCEYDFWAVTDHAENSSDYQWWSIQKIADLFHVPERFVPLYGFEWTSADTGHQNVIYGDVERGAPIFSAFAEGTEDPAGLWAALEQHPDHPAITIPHHPGSAMVHTDWAYHDPRFSRLVEIFQACRGNYEAPGVFRQYSDGTAEGTFTLDGLLRGHKFGFIASSDHGHGASYVGAYAVDLSRAGVFESLHARRTFAATTRDVGLDVRVGDLIMGEEGEVEGPRTLTYDVFGYTDVARIEVVRNGELVHHVAGEPDVPDGWQCVRVRLEWGEADVSTVWDGTLRLDQGHVVPTPFWSPDIVAVAEREVHWRNTTHSFGEPYGAQRGDVELTLVGPPTAVVTVTVAGTATDVPLGQLATALANGVRVPLDVPAGTFFVQPGVGGLLPLAATATDTDNQGDPPSTTHTTTHSTTRSVQGRWTDDSTAPAFYYVRVYLVDGEMAWSSPIWVTTTGSTT